MFAEGIAVQVPEFPEVSAETVRLIVEQHQYQVRTFSRLPAPQP